MEKQNMAIWIESQTTLGRNAKTIRLARTLKTSLPAVIGHLHLFWHNVLEQREDGDISNWSSDDVAFYSGWDGDPKQFYDALCNEQHQFIDIIGDLVLVHDWLDTAGKYLMKRYVNNNREKLNTIWQKYGKTYGRGEDKEEQKYTKDSLEMQITMYFWGKIKENNPNAKEPDFQKWASHIDGLLRIDKYTKDQIGQVIQWIQKYVGGNGFTWKANILSTKTLREKFPTLITQMNNGQPAKNSKKAGGLTTPADIQRTVSRLNKTRT